MFKTIVENLIVALIVVSVFELLALYALRRESALYRSQLTFPTPSGYIAGRVVSGAGDSPCSLLRLSSDYCKYCRIDQPHYKSLRAAATNAGCSSFLMAPKAGHLKFQEDGSGTKFLQFVDFEMGRALNPFSTPQTILLDRTGRVLWYRDGTMDERAAASAIRALGSVQ